MKSIRERYAGAVERGWFSQQSNTYLGLGLVGLIAGIWIGGYAWTVQRGDLAPLAALIGGAGLFGVVPGIRNVRRQSWIREHGIECWGSVLNVSTASTRYGATYTLTYQYQDTASTTHVGKVVTGSGTAARMWTAGDAGQVRYDPDRPSRSAWIGRPGHRST